LIILALTLVLTLSNSDSRVSGSAALLGLVNFICFILSMAILIRVVISWFPVNRHNPAILLLDSVTEPILSRLRRIIPLVGMFDFSPFVAIVILFLIPVILNAVFR
jgi:YggT family protein